MFRVNTDTPTLGPVGYLRHWRDDAWTDRTVKKVKFLTHVVNTLVCVRYIIVIYDKDVYNDPFWRPGDTREIDSLLTVQTMLKLGWLFISKLHRVYTDRYVQHNLGYNTCIYHFMLRAWENFYYSLYRVLYNSELPQSHSSSLRKSIGREMNDITILPWHHDVHYGVHVGSRVLSNRKRAGNKQADKSCKAHGHSLLIIIHRMLAVSTSVARGETSILIIYTEDL
jgi:hypothetical protein